MQYVTNCSVMVLGCLCNSLLPFTVSQAHCIAQFSVFCTWIRWCLLFLRVPAGKHLIVNKHSTANTTRVQNLCHVNITTDIITPYQAPQIQSLMFSSLKYPSCQQNVLPPKSRLDKTVLSGAQDICGKALFACVPCQPFGTLIGMSKSAVR